MEVVMLFLSKIVINGFKSSSKSVQVVFSENQSSVIYGDNGCGKTTFLKILNAVFKQDDSTLLEEEVENITIDYKFNDGNNQEPDSLKWQTKQVVISKVTEINEQQTNLFINNDEISHNERLEAGFSPHSLRYYEEARLTNGVEEHYDWEKFSNSELSNSKSLSLGVDRGSQSTRLNISPKIISNFLSRRRDMRSTFKSQSHLRDFSDELVAFLKSRSGGSNRGINAVDFGADHVFLKEVNMDNVESTLLTKYRNARRNAARKIQNALFDTLASAITEQGVSGPAAPIPSNFNEIINNNKELLIEALDDKSENSFKDGIVKELRKISSEVDVNSLKDNPLLSKLLVEMSNQLKDSEAELSAINTVIDRFDFFTGDEKRLIINTTSIKVKIGKNRHSISKLSSGERHILTLFTLLLDQGRHRNFIIIDEPEISLNATWQEALLPTLEELLPKCQIIVASHSPILAESIDNLAELEVIADEINTCSEDDENISDDIEGLSYE
jgi:ABC-type lipoprotein export system ATPase subunit